MNLITCIIQKKEMNKVIKATLNAGAIGVTSFSAHGTGIRQKIGDIGKQIQPEKEIIFVVTREEQTHGIFDAIIRIARLKSPGQGLAFVQKIDKIAGFMKRP
jgi:nitrogen regulatory protein PII